VWPSRSRSGTGRPTPLGLRQGGRRGGSEPMTTGRAALMLGVDCTAAAGQLCASLAPHPAQNLPADWRSRSWSSAPQSHRLTTSTRWYIRTSARQCRSSRHAATGAGHPWLAKARAGGEPPARSASLPWAAAASSAPGVRRARARSQRSGSGPRAGPRAGSCDHRAPPPRARHRPPPWARSPVCGWPRR
jgi:hypothetical protein